jgi:hypothetical protein
MKAKTREMKNRKGGSFNKFKRCQNIVFSDCG